MELPQILSWTPGHSSNVFATPWVTWLFELDHESRHRVNSLKFKLAAALRLLKAFSIILVVIEPTSTASDHWQAVNSIIGDLLKFETPRLIFEL